MENSKLSPVIIIVLIVVVVAIAALAINMLTSGNGVGKSHEDEEKIVPTLEVTLNTKESDQESVTITIVATTSDELGIESITLPDGTVINADTKDYVVTENGVYEFKAKGGNGEEISTTVSVENIREISANNPYIPKGFEYKGGEVDTGFVIEDSYGNQFVWIPVPTGILTRNTMLDAKYTESNNTSSELVNSVAKNYGFYMGRFEASSFDRNGVKVAASMAGKIPWTTIDFSDANKYAMSMAEVFEYGEDVHTAIINSYAWDTTLEWINKTVPNYSTNTSYGNYSGTIYPTGATQSDIVNNICDLAGNVREWTT